MPQRFSADNRSVYLTGVREGETYDALYRLDLQTRAAWRRCTRSTAQASTDVITDFADREVVGVTRLRGAADRPLAGGRTIRAAQTYQALQRAFPNQHVNVTSTSDDGRLAIVFVDSDVNPGDYYLFDTETMRAEFLRAGAHLDRSQADAAEGADRR